VSEGDLNPHALAGTSPSNRDGPLRCLERRASLLLSDCTRWHVMTRDSRAAVELLYARRAGSLHASEYSVWSWVNKSGE
jgi:hypothetical protein